jgi:methyl-accepting chemotaxis protein
MAATGVAFERGEGSMAKLAATEVAVASTERAIQTMGGWGYITDHPVEKWYRDAKLYTIFEGTSEIQRVVISNAIAQQDGAPPLHVQMDAEGSALNKAFGRGTETRTKVMDKAMAALPANAKLAPIKAEGLSVLNDACGPVVQAAAQATDEAAVLASQEAFMRDCKPKFAAVTEKLTVVTDEVMTAANQESENLSASAKTTIYATFGAVIGGLALVLVAGFFLIRAWLARPIQHLQRTMLTLANGDLSALVAGADRRDEVGSMAKALQVFKDNGLKTRELERRSDEQRQQSEEQRLATAERERIRADAMAQAHGSRSA